MKKGIVWFRNNLRISDNECLVRALDECDEVLCVYILESRVWNTSSEPARMGSIRAKFLYVEQFQNSATKPTYMQRVLEH